MTGLTRGDRWAERFLLVRPLGATHGESWLAEDVEAGRRVVLRLETPAWPARALEAEAAALERLGADAAVARPLGVVRDGARAALVQEWLSGGDLGEYRGRRWREAVLLLLPVLATLERAHAAGVVHGDLKPANVLLDADGRARLVDFGAGLVHATGRVADGAAVTGSPHSRSPAQWQGVAPTPADDAWGLGALLYELACGRPPFYPEIDADRVQHADAPPLAAPQPLPPAFDALVRALLAKDPARRPTVAAARAELARTVEAAVETPPRPELSVPLVPPPRPAVAPRWQPAPAGTVDRGAGPRAPRWPLAVGAAFVLALVGVFLVLPRWVEQRAPGTVVVVPPAAPAMRADEAGPGELPSDPAALAALAEAKTDAEDARERHAEVLGRLAESRAELWAGEDWARLQALGVEAAARYERRDYVAARAAWEEGTALAGRVEKGRAPALAALLARGRTALGAGDADAARAALERLLEIEPAHREAQALLARARTLDEVLALVDEAARFERDGRRAEAAERYRRALGLDAQTTAASEGLARIAQAERQAALARTIAEGQRALAGGDREGARAAFERARGMQPDSPAVRDALAQLETGERTDRIADLRAAGESAERAERWAEAQKAYEAALGIDGTLVFAREGLARAAPRARLDAQLRALLEPERLANPDARARARTLLGEAAPLARPDAPVLRAQLAALERAVGAAETPVKLVLVSDNQTDVVVYRVGRLGAFDNRELELLPGRYTIVGTRAGFRDVRREVLLAPGSGAPPVEIRTTEPI